MTAPTSIQDRPPAQASPVRRTTLWALGSEWTKLWSVRSTWWLTAGTALSMVFFAPVLGGSLANSYRDDHSSSRVPVGHCVTLAVLVVQLVVAALAMTTITSEYATGSIRNTLQCVPSRGRMLFAKSAVLGPLLLAVGVVLAAAGAALSKPVLFEYGVFDPAATLGTVLTTGVYLGLVAVFAVGLGAAVRSAVGTLTVAVVLLAVVPGALEVTSSAALRTVGDYTMTVAGMHLLDGDTKPYPGLIAALVVVVWALAGLLAGYLVLRRRDS
jgi:ABC-2 type transport system permease protein